MLAVGFRRYSGYSRQRGKGDISVLGRAIPIVLLLVLVLCGCDHLDKNATVTGSAPASSTALAKAIAPPAAIPAEQIEMFDMVMQRSDARVLTGDLRPFWIVSGRIRNNSGEHLSKLQLRIYIKARGNTEEVQDEANLHLEADVSPGGVGSFSRNIQILPPQKAWDWTYEVVEARSSDADAEAEKWLAEHGGK